MSAATAVTATFAQTSMPQIVVTVSGSGTVTSSPAGINCPSTCSAPFAQNAVVTLTETPRCRLYVYRMGRRVRDYRDDMHRDCCRRDSCFCHFQSAANTAHCECLRAGNSNQQSSGHQLPGNLFSEFPARHRGDADRICEQRLRTRLMGRILHRQHQSLRSYALFARDQLQLPSRRWGLLRSRSRELEREP